jgi:membrane-bound lytic murein transglycosylase A
MNERRSGRRLALALALWAAAATGVAAWALWFRVPAVAPAAEDAAPPAEPAEPALELRAATFAGLPGWADDRHAEALPPLLASCRVLARLPPERPVGRDGVGGTAADWRVPCAQAAAVPAGDAAAARTFFEAAFRPWAISDRGAAEGLFTGYYEPTLHGSRRRGGRFTVPLYRRPPELVEVDLGRFRDDLAGERIAGLVEGVALVPFADRVALDAGALAGRGLELAWVDDPVEAFFLHIQGSGRVELAEGGVLRVGYAGHNGHPYTAIGRTLFERGELALEEVSMQSIRAWLAARPDEAGELLAANRSFIFFRELDGDGPVGSLGTPLTPGRSLAVDRIHLPLGAPLWLDATAPHPDPAGPDRPLRRLMVAHDTGGAIRGPVRGDVFWGHGDEAAEVAGRMKHRGRLWLLLPRAVTPVQG